MAVMQRLVRRFLRGATVVAVLLGATGLPAADVAVDVPVTPVDSEYIDLWQDYGAPEGPSFFDMTVPEPVWAWSVDYRFRSITSSHTSYEFGTPDPPPTGWTPLSRLDFPLNSLWQGLQFGLQREDWGVHLEYLMPMQKQVQGNLKDYDWEIPNADYTIYSESRQRWVEGGMLDFGAEFRLLERPFELPMGVWSTAGFRWQRFHLVASDLVQYDLTDPSSSPYRYAGDVIDFNQQYYQYYLGCQLRSNVAMGSLPPVRLTFQTDWAYTVGYNIDHHLIRTGNRYTIENTYGDTWHTALTAEAPLRTWLSLGCQVDYSVTRTTGSHRLLNMPLDEDLAWTNGVRVWSEQTWLTAFIRISR